MSAKAPNPAPIEGSRPPPPPAPPRAHPCTRCASLEASVEQLRAACRNLQDALALADRRPGRRT